MLLCRAGCKRMISQGSAQPGSCREPLCKQFLLQEKPGALYAAIVPQTPGSPPARFSNRGFQVIPLTLKSFCPTGRGTLIFSNRSAFTGGYFRRWFCNSEVIGQMKNMAYAVAWSNLHSSGAKSFKYFLWAWNRSAAKEASILRVPVPQTPTGEMSAELN